MAVLHQLQSDFAPDNSGGLLERAQGYGIVLRIKEPVESSSAGVHPAGNLSFGDTLFLHGGFDMAGDNTLDRVRAGLVMDAFFTKPAIEG